MSGAYLLLGGPSARPFPKPPSKSLLQNGRITMQGLDVFVTTRAYSYDGRMPWWSACWAWLDKVTRAEVAAQLLEHGDDLLLIQLPDGAILYDEPNQFYSPDKFGGLDLTHGNTQIDPEFIALLEEALELGFKGLWIMLGGDASYDIAVTQTRMLGPALAASKCGDLNEYVVQIPGWDGTWHKPDANGTGYTPAQIKQFSIEAVAAGAKHLGFEQGVGYNLGEISPPPAYSPGGAMDLYCLILLEFNDGEFNTDDVWQILPRAGIRYIRPPEQPADDDPRPPNDLAGTDKVARIFEFGIYGGVRRTPAEEIRQWGRKFESLGCVDVCY